MNVSEAVLGVIQRAEINGTALRVVERLDRKLYVEVNRVLEALGGKWDRRSQAHLFAGDPREALERVVAEGTVIDARRDYDFFPTPPDLADALVADARIRAGDRILEPSAGDGRIASAIRKAVPRARIRVCELNSAFHPLLQEQGHELLAADFLSLDPDVYTFDRIVMNPPFSKGQDIAHVSHAWRLLSPGGRLVAVMANGVAFRQERAAVAFRALVEAHGAVEPLPEGAFRESGTMVRTVRVILDRPLFDSASPSPSAPAPWRREQLGLFSEAPAHKQLPLFD